MRWRQEVLARWAQQTSRVVTFGCSRVPSVAGSSRGRTDKGVTTESQRNARDSGWAHWGQFGQRRSTVDAQQQRGSVWRDEGSGLWVVGCGRRSGYASASGSGADGQDAASDPNLAITGKARAATQAL
jgi:hypothetical protein